MSDTIEIISRTVGGILTSISSLSLTITSIRRILKELGRGETLSSEKQYSAVVNGLFCMLLISLAAIVGIATFFILSVIFPANDQIYNTTAS